MRIPSYEDTTGALATGLVLGLLHLSVWLSVVKTCSPKTLFYALARFRWRAASLYALDDALRKQGYSTRQRRQAHGAAVTFHRLFYADLYPEGAHTREPASSFLVLVLIAPAVRVLTPDQQRVYLNELARVYFRAEFYAYVFGGRCRSVEDLRFLADCFALGFRAEHLLEWPTPPTPKYLPRLADARAQLALGYSPDEVVASLKLAKLFASSSKDVLR